MITERLKCGSHWIDIPGYNNRAQCSFCKKKESIETLENEQHLWLECRNNGQALAWNTARTAWNRTTSRDWPIISLGLIKGAAALTFENDQNGDSESLRTLISMTIWAIWKSRSKNSINNQNVATCEAKEELERDAFHRRWWEDKPTTRFEGPLGQQVICRFRFQNWPYPRFPLMGCGSGGRMPNGRNDPPANRTGVPHTAPKGATVHNAFPSFPPTKKRI
jgi:hypothetical protein